MNTLTVVEVADEAGDEAGVEAGVEAGDESVDRRVSMIVGFREVGEGNFSLKR